MKLRLSGLILASISAGHTAHAAITYTFTNQTWTGFNFTQALAAGSFTGTLTAVSVDATLNASSSYTYADDICVYVNGGPALALGGLVQVGGFSNLNATQRYSWPTGGSNAPGTRVTGTKSLTGPITFNSTDNPTMAIWIGNGYGAAGTSGNWTGTVTLEGLSTAVPEPGSMLLGMSGLVAMASRRVRRRGRDANPSSNGEAGTAAS